MNLKSGISLAALVLTIVIMIILSSVVIISFQDDSDPIDASKRAKFQTDITSFRDELNLHLSRVPRDNIDNINITLEDFNGNGTIDIQDLNEKRERLVEYIPSIDGASITNQILYADILAVQNGQLKLHSDEKLIRVYSLINAKRNRNIENFILNVINEEE